MTLSLKSVIIFLRSGLYFCAQYYYTGLELGFVSLFRNNFGNQKIKKFSLLPNHVDIIAKKCRNQGRALRVLNWVNIRVHSGWIGRVHLITLIQLLFGVAGGGSRCAGVLRRKSKTLKKFKPKPFKFLPYYHRTSTRRYDEISTIYISFNQSQYKRRAQISML